MKKLKLFLFNAIKGSQQFPFKKHVLLLFLIFLMFQNCDPYHTVNNKQSGSSSNSPSGSVLAVDQVLQTQALSILSNKCGTCHDSAISGGVTHILDVNHLIDTQLIVPGDPNQGKLIGVIQNGSMPVGGSVSAQELQVLKDWITSMHWVSSSNGTNTSNNNNNPIPVLLPADKTVSASASLHEQAMNILNINCAGCHQGVTSGGITDILVADHLVETGLVEIGNPEGGRLIGAITDGSMPKGNGANVTSSDLATLKSWISSMTLVDKATHSPLSTRVPLTSTFTGVFTNIIQPKCFACHGPVMSKEGLNFSTYTSVQSRASQMLNLFSLGRMPESPYLSLTNSELDAFQTWVNNGALNN